MTYYPQNHVRRRYEKAYTFRPAYLRPRFNGHFIRADRQIIKLMIILGFIAALLATFNN